MDAKAMHKIMYGLFILSARRGQFDNACIINTAIQATTRPNRITITVNKHEFTHDMVAESGIFSLSVLHVDTPFSVFQRFGMRSGRDGSKFEDFPSAVRGDNGLYIVPEYANAYICAQVIQAVDVGTHTVFVADVTDCQVLGDKESATYDYYQRFIKPAPQKTPVKGWVCSVCGHRYEGETMPPDFICPVCHHSAEFFNKEE